MNDYITRQEFEQAIESLRCYGDQQTINVTQTPGGQVVTSTQVISTEPDSADNYVSVSYDSDLLRFTVTITALPVVWINGANITSNFSVTAAPIFPLNKTGQYYTATTTMSKTFTFDKPASNVELALLASPPKLATGNDTASGNITWSASSLTASNAVTEARKTGLGSSFCDITLNSDGTHAFVSNVTTVPIVAGYGVDQPYLLVNTSLRKIYVYNAVSPINFTSSITGNGYTYAEPFSTTMIFGWNAGDPTVTLDEVTNSGSYDAWYQIGSVIIDTDNVVLKSEAINYNSHSLLPHIGYSGSFVDNDGNTIEVLNGLIIDKHV